jgi:molybdenum cofactor biosynthesis protein B
MSAPPPPKDRHHLHGDRSLRWAVVSTSDTHTEEDDLSGQLARQLLFGAGHQVSRYVLVANRMADVRDALGPWLKEVGVDAAVTICGTGVSSRDISVEALESMGGRLLPGFGELFRSLSFAEVGPLAMNSRAGLFVIGGKPVFALPGSERAVRTAFERLILPGVQHLVEELAR